MQNFRKINFTVNVESGLMVDAKDGSMLNLSDRPSFYYGETLVLCISLVDSDMNAVSLSAADLFELSGDSNFSHNDSLMFYSDSNMVDIAGDWASISRASGKISVRVNCLTEGFYDKISTSEQLVAWFELKFYAAGSSAASIMLRDKFIACNVVMAGEGSPASAAPEYYNAVQVESLLAAKLTAVSNLSDISSVSAARSNLGLGDSATKNVGTTAGTVAAGDHTHSGSSVWGAITGTLASQTDLQTALNAKLSAASNLSDLASASTARTNLGLAASAVTDTTNASNISSGTLDAARLPSSGVTAGSYGSSTTVPVPTVDAYGRITSMSTAIISASGGGTITDNPQTAAYTQTATGQQIRFTSATAAACTLTLMTPPANGSAQTYVKNESNYAITLSGAINGSSSTTYILAGLTTGLLVSDGTYWRVSKIDDAMPDISSAATGKTAVVSSNAITAGGLAKWTLNNVLTDSFGSYTLTNSGLTFATDSAYPLGGYVAVANGSSYATFTPTSLPAGATARTLFVRFKTTTAANMSLLGYGSSSSGNEISLGTYADGRPYLETYGSELFGVGNCKDGAWHSIACTYNGTTMYMYFDGILNNSSAMTLNTTLTWGNIGSVRNGTSKFTGSIGDARIYNRVLTASEILAIHNIDIASSWQLSNSYSSQNLVSRTTTAPTIAAGTGAGTSPTVTIEGTDSSGKITVTTGTSPTAAATVATITFASTFPNTPYIVLSPANANAAALTGAAQVYATSTTTTATLTAGSTALTASTSYVWNYKIF